MAFLPARILSIGKALPKTKITNEDLTGILDTSDEWIKTRTGIVERNVLSGQEENATTLGIEATKDALKKANLTGADIDLIIVATSCPYNIYPSTACEIQNAIGAKVAPAFDISAACTGMMYAIQVGRSMLSTGFYKNVLLVATDQNSRFVDWEDRSTCILFGDGAGAMILTQSEDGIDDILAVDIQADGAQGHHITSFLSGDNCPLVTPHEIGSPSIKMNGKEVYKFVVSTMPNSIDKCLEEAGLKPEDIDYLIPHQANLRIIEGLQSRLNYTDEQVITNIHMHGNTSAASVPIAMCEGIDEGKIKLPSTAILCAFGAGLTWGSLIIRLREGIY